MNHPTAPIIGVAGLSNSGKTTLIARLIPELQRAGLRVGTMKHHRGRLDLDTPGKDTWLHRRAGAAGTVISSPGLIGLIREVDGDPDPQELAELLHGMDLILAEGYKRARIPKIEVHRADLGEPPVCLNDPFLMALITTVRAPWDGPRFDPDDVSGLARFLIRRLQLTP